MKIETNAPDEKKLTPAASLAAEPKEAKVEVAVELTTPDERVASELTPKTKPEELSWDCLHCEAFSYSTTNKPPSNCPRCGHKDFVLSKPPLNDPDSKLYLQALFRQNKGEGREAVTKHLMKRYPFKTIPGTKSNTIWVYQDGVYTPTGKVVIEEETEKILGNLATNAQRSEVIGKINANTFITQEELQQDNPYLVCVENGILNLKDGTLSDHDPEIIFLSKLTVKLDPQAECPEIMNFLYSTLQHKDIPTFLEFMGYVLFASNKYKRCLLFLGGRDTGKTTLYNLVVEFIGRENVSTRGLQDLLCDKNATHSLHGKLLNTCDELKATELKNTETFKAITGGAVLINAEQKFKDSYAFFNRAKLLNTTNKVPIPTEDLDDAYYIRWIVLHCLNVFQGENDDPEIGLKITTPSELSGFLNLALLGFQRLERQKGFTYQATPQETREIMHKSGDSISAFFTEWLEETPGVVIAKDDTYEAYVAYCKENNHKTETMDKLGKRFKARGILEKKHKHIKTGKRVKHWNNLRFCPTCPNYSENIYNDFLTTTQKSANGGEKDRTAVTLPLTAHLEGGSVPPSKKEEKTAVPRVLSISEKKVTVSTAKEVYLALKANKKGVVANALAKPHKEEIQLLLEQGLIRYAPGGFMIISEKWGSFQ